MATQFRLTRRGQALLAKVQTGEQLRFTKIGIGNGTVGDPEMQFEMTTLVSPREYFPLESIVDNRDGSATLKAVLSNTDTTERFYIREIGIYADDPEVGEILYAVCDSSQSADLFSANTDRELNIIIEVAILIGNAENVTLTVNTSLLYITRAEHFDLAGNGRTTENVKKNADDILRLQLDMALANLQNAVGGEGSNLIIVEFDDIDETEDVWGIYEKQFKRLKC